MKQQNQILLIAVCAALITGCSESTPSSSTSNESAPEPSAVAASDLAALSNDLLAPEPIEGPMSIVAARQNVQPGSDIVLTGYIGGRAEPMADGRAVFTLADTSLKRCDAEPGDGCTTPWDACCVSSDIITASIASVQVVDSEGSVLKQSLNGWNGIQSGSTVTVSGKIAEGSSSSTLIVNADKIHVNRQQ